MLKIYGSELCPDCTAFKERLDAAGIPYEFINITESMRNLKEFLRLRDTEAVFADAREKGYVGIPAFVREDGSISLDTDSYLIENGSSLQPGSACRIDGSGC